VLALANKGWRRALQDDAHLRNGLNVLEGKVTCAEVANDLHYSYHAPQSLLAA
jgi:alanine dehydrogenase